MNKDIQHKLRILFIYYDNKYRSSMAEGLVKKILKGIAHVESVVIDAWRSNASKEAMEVMKKEFGIDISDNKPKDMKNLILNNFDYIVTIDSYIDTIIREAIKLDQTKLYLGI